MPFTQVSLVVQVLPSSQGSPSIGLFWQPTLGSQLSLVQGLLSLQATLTSMGLPLQAMPNRP